jgi:hypothetical protein
MGKGAETMECPYTVNILQTNKWKYTYDESNNGTETVHILKEDRKFVDCLQEQCGAWQNGRCCYASVNFHNE